MTKNYYRCNHCGKTMKTSQMDKEVPNCCGVPMTKVQSKDCSSSTSKADSNCYSSDEMGGCCASEDC